MTVPPADLAGLAEPDPLRRRHEQAAVERTVATFIAAWAEPDADRRERLLGSACAVDVVHENPLARSRGATELAAHIGKVIRQLPGHRLVRTSGVQVQFDHLRFGWNFQDPKGQPVLEGVNTAVVDGDGRLVTVISFFGSLPPMTYSFGGGAWSRR